VALSAKAGIAATSGSQVTPSPDPGYVGLYRVTVAHGATTLAANNIAQLDTAPFLFKKLPELPKWVQSGEWAWGDDTGTANAMAVKLTPIPTAYKKGMHIFVKKGAAANTGNVTINVNGLGAVAVLDPTGAQIGAGNMGASQRLHLVYDGTTFIYINGAITQTTVNSLTAISGEGITVSGGGVVSLNYPGLDDATPSALDIWSFYDQEAAHHRSILHADLMALIAGSSAVAALGGGLLGMTAITASGTVAVPSGARKALAFATGGGAGGGPGGAPSGVNLYGSGGGGAGATVIAEIDVVGVTSLAATIGLGGAPNVDGGSTALGTYLTAGGGKKPPHITHMGGDGGEGTLGAGVNGWVLPGGCGHAVDWGSNNNDCGGAGASSFWGGGARGGHTISGTPALRRGAPGSGGAGAAGSAGSPVGWIAGTAGLDGAILILWFK